MKHTTINSNLSSIKTIKSPQFHKLSTQTKENAEEWMSRLRLAAVEFNYREVDRQLKEQFIHGLNSNDMLAGIISELTKVEDSAYITSEQVLGWAKRVEAQGAQSAIMDSLTKTKEFDKVKKAKGEPIHNGRNVQTCVKAPIKKTCSYCGSSHPPKQSKAYGKMCIDCSKTNHFREVCRSRRNTAVHYIEQVPDHCNVEEDHIDTVNINSFIFNSKWSAITANLKMSSSQVNIIIPCKVDTGSDDNILPLHLYKIIF